MPDEIDYDRLFKLGVNLLKCRGHLHQEAEDICQDALIRSTQKYNPEKGKYETYFTIWLLGLGRRRYSQNVRHNTRSKVYGVQKQGDISRKVSHPKATEYRDDYNFIMRGLNRREKFILTKIGEGFNYREIGDYYGLSRGWIRRLALGAFDKIRERISQRLIMF